MCDCDVRDTALSEAKGLLDRTPTELVVRYLEHFAIGATLGNSEPVDAPHLRFVAADAVA